MTMTRSPLISKVKKSVNGPGEMGSKVVQRRRYVRNLVDIYRRFSSCSLFYGGLVIPKEIDKSKVTVMSDVYFGINRLYLIMF